MCRNQGETSLKNISAECRRPERPEILLALLLMYLVIFPIEENTKFIQNDKLFPHTLLKHSPFPVLFL